MRALLGAASTLTFALALALAVLVVVSAADVERAHGLLSRALSPEARTDAAVEETLQTLSVGLYAGGARQRAELAALQERVTLLTRRADLLALSLGAVLGAVLALRQAATRGDPSALTRSLLGVSAVCLAVGLLAPMLSIVTQRDLPLLGQVVLRYDSKSITGTVQTLATGGQLGVAVLLGLFGMLVPLAKLALATLVCLRPHGALATATRRVLHGIGRWSMTDVFVVAVLLAVLAGGSGADSDAWAGQGLWFYAAYTLLSLWAARRLERAVPAPARAPAPAPGVVSAAPPREDMDR